jgi:hypothetical protein
MACSRWYACGSWLIVCLCLLLFYFPKLTHLSYSLTLVLCVRVCVCMGAGFAMVWTFGRLIPGALAGVTLEDALVAKHAFLHVKESQPYACKMRV